MAEFDEGILQWWWAHRTVLAGLSLFLSSVLTVLFPMMVERRLPGLSFRELAAQHPNLRWLQWGHSAWFLGTVMLTVPGWVVVFKRSPRLSDDQEFFLITFLLSIFGLSLGVLARWTGVYRGLGRNWFTDKYYLVADTNLWWIPLTQITAAIAIAAMSLAGLFGR